MGREMTLGRLNANDSLEKVKLELKDYISLTRAVQTFVDTPLFKRIWNDGSMDDRNFMLDQLRELKPKALKEWCMRHQSIDLEERPYSVLIDMARGRGLPNYKRYSKNELVDLLRKDLEDAELSDKKDEAEVGSSGRADESPASQSPESIADVQPSRTERYGE